MSKDTSAFPFVLSLVSLCAVHLSVLFTSLYYSSPGSSHMELLVIRELWYGDKHGRTTAPGLTLYMKNRYDTRGAKAVGMKTIYVYRWTDDINEDQAAVRRENDAYLEGMDGLSEAVARLGSS